MSRGMFIAIEGPIGVGKTTLARLLQEEFQAELLLEIFEENPFLKLFYTDRARYAFQTQIFFLLSRYRQRHEVVPNILQRSNLISDYTFTKDRLFARLNLSSDELEMYERIHAILAAETGYSTDPGCVGTAPIPACLAGVHGRIDPCREIIAL
ncbi:MAG: deoxynucleoside kinase [Chloroflexi bacterium]|nr:deoxynucleoside kinase [Chloroflexota bacterium]